MTQKNALLGAQRPSDASGAFATQPNVPQTRLRGQGNCVLHFRGAWPGATAPSASPLSRMHFCCAIGAHANVRTHRRPDGALVHSGLAWLRPDTVGALAKTGLRRPDTVRVLGRDSGAAIPDDERFFAPAPGRSAPADRVFRQLLHRFRAGAFYRSA